MAFYLAKLLLTSGLIVLITEVVKRSDKFGALIAALPLTTLLVISWMYFEQQPNKKIADLELRNLIFQLVQPSHTRPLHFLDVT